MPALDERILTAARETAKRKGYTDPAAIRFYALLTAVLGPGFDERARVREYFASASGTLDERLLKMQAWSNPNCWLRDDTPITGWPEDVPMPVQLQPGYGFQIDVPQLMTPAPVIDGMLDLAELQPGDFLLDLGSGDGGIAIAAARRFGVLAGGVDIDPDQVQKAAANARDVAHLVSFRRGDLLDADVSGATVVTLYLLRSMNLLLRDKLRTQLRSGARVISRSFDMGDWSPDTVVETDHGPIYRWRIG